MCSLRGAHPLALAPGTATVRSLLLPTRCAREKVSSGSTPHAKHARSTIENLEKTARLEAYRDHRRDIFEINRLLIDDPELARLIGYEREEVMGFVFIGYAEMAWTQKVSGVASPEAWGSQEK